MYISWRQRKDQKFPDLYCVWPGGGRCGRSPAIPFGSVIAIEDTMLVMSIIGLI